MRSRFWALEAAKAATTSQVVDFRGEDTIVIEEEQRRALEEAACAVREQAYAPYSEFKVGAAIMAGSGAIFSGANVENASFGMAICAERAAIVQAISAGERAILAVAVCTESGVTPCGACRQVIREFAADCPVYLLDVQGRSRETSLAELLPQSFGSADLE